MKVAGLQMDLAWERPEENYARATKLVGEAAAAGARLVVLPEMFNTGFCVNGGLAAGHAEDCVSFLAELAREHSLSLLAGFAVPSAAPGRSPRNACALFAPDGSERLRYHKIHPFSMAGEHKYFEAGEDLPSVTIEGLRVTALICYDLRFPEPFRAAADDTDLFVVIANWPAPRRAAWRCLARARAIENQCYVLAVNRVGDGGGLSYAGDTALYGPMGERLAGGEPASDGPAKEERRSRGKASDGQAGDGPAPGMKDGRSLADGEVAVVIADVEASVVQSVRQQFSFLSDRRPELYPRLRSLRQSGEDAERGEA